MYIHFFPLTVNAKNHIKISIKISFYQGSIFCDKKIYFIIKKYLFALNDIQSFQKIKKHIESVILKLQLKWKSMYTPT